MNCSPQERRSGESDEFLLYSLGLSRGPEALLQHLRQENDQGAAARAVEKTGERRTVTSSPPVSRPGSRRNSGEAATRPHRSGSASGGKSGGVSRGPLPGDEMPAALKSLFSFSKSGKEKEAPRPRGDPLARLQEVSRDAEVLADYRMNREMVQHACTFACQRSVGSACAACVELLCDGRTATPALAQLTAEVAATREFMFISERTDLEPVYADLDVVHFEMKAPRWASAPDEEDLRDLPPAWESIVPPPSPNLPLEVVPVKEGQHKRAKAAGGPAKGAAAAQTPGQATRAGTKGDRSRRKGGSKPHTAAADGLAAVRAEVAVPVPAARGAVVPDAAAALEATETPGASTSLRLPERETGADVSPAKPACEAGGVSPPSFAQDGAAGRDVLVSGKVDSCSADEPPERPEPVAGCPPGRVTDEPAPAPEASSEDMGRSGGDEPRPSSADVAEAFVAAASTNVQQAGTDEQPPAPASVPEPEPEAEPEPVPVPEPVPEPQLVPRRVGGGSFFKRMNDAAHASSLSQSPLPPIAGAASSTAGAGGAPGLATAVPADVTSSTPHDPSPEPPESSGTSGLDEWLERLHTEPLPKHSHAELIKIQRGMCFTCSKPLKRPGQPSRGGFLCEYTGRLHCSSCMDPKDSLALVPSLLVNECDARPRPVCARALEYLEDRLELPNVSLATLPPGASVLQHPELRRAQAMRKQLAEELPFVLTCRRQEELVDTVVGPLEYMMTSSDLYSLADLAACVEGTLGPRLERTVSQLAAHITSGECTVCYSQGSICEGCDRSEPIFPFALRETARCPKCRALFHRPCFKSLQGSCPRCARLARRGSSTSSGIS